MLGRTKVPCKKYVYTDEQLRYMIAPPVAGLGILTVKEPGPINDLAARLRNLPPKPASELYGIPKTKRVPILGSIGDSPRERAQIAASRERQKQNNQKAGSSAVGDPLALF